MNVWAALRCDILLGADPVKPILRQADNIAMDTQDGPTCVPGESAGANRRRHGRLRAEELRTDLGKVTDLSASGMRVICDHRKPPADGSILHVELKHPEGSLPIKGRVVWVKKRSGGKHELGITFEDVNPSTKAGLVAVARLALQSVVAELQREQRSGPAE